MNLIDTSAWVDYLRDVDSGARDEVARLLLNHGDVVTTEPVVMELLAGARPDSLAQIQRLTDGLPLVRVDARTDYHDAAAIFRAARSGGYTVRKLIDCLIAAVAVRNEATIVHKDGDFDIIAGVAPLRSRSYV